jgi:Flp pilus assembly CpaE family ATPase
MAANSLAKMISVAHQNDLVVGLADNVIPKGVAILQYADDTILMIQHDLEQAKNLKLLLYLFEAMSGLKINSEKSEVMLILDDDNKIQTYSDLFNCQSGNWPIKYLGTPICARRPTVAEMSFLGDKTKKK